MATSPTPELNLRPLPVNNHYLCVLIVGPSIPLQTSLASTNPQAYLSILELCIRPGGMFVRLSLSGLYHYQGMLKRTLDICVQLQPITKPASIGQAQYQQPRQMQRQQKKQQLMEQQPQQQHVALRTWPQQQALVSAFGSWSKMYLVMLRGCHGEGMQEVFVGLLHSWVNAAIFWTDVVQRSRGQQEQQQLKQEQQEAQVNQQQQKPGQLLKQSLYSSTWYVELQLLLPMVKTFLATARGLGVTPLGVEGSAGTRPRALQRPEGAAAARGPVLQAKVMLEWSAAAATAAAATTAAAGGRAVVVIAIALAAAAHQKRSVRQAAPAALRLPAAKGFAASPAKAAPGAGESRAYKSAPPAAQRQHPRRNWTMPLT